MSKAAKEKSCPVHPEAWQETITQKIINSLEEGVPPWVKPWKEDRGSVGISLPANAKTLRPYRGINVIALWLAAMERGYSSHRWMTYKQAGEIGAHIKRGERAEKIIFVDFKEPKTKKAKEGEEERKIPVLQVFSVFNLDQCEDVPAPYLPRPREASDEERIAPFMPMTRLARDAGATILFGNNRAFYRPSDDIIAMPYHDQFESTEAYSGTLGHEAVHWTAHQNRLGRSLGKRFGDEAYAMEEIVAELGSAYLCAGLGIAPTTRSNASYIESWIKVLKNDRRAIISAAAHASHAYTYIHEQAGRTQNLMAAE